MYNVYITIYLKSGDIMTDRETAEIRRRYKTDKNNITHVAGCLVTQTHEIASEFDVPVASMTEDETDAVFGALKRVLSNVGRNFVDVAFPASEVPNGDVYKMLDALRASGCKDETARRALFEKIASCVESDEGYVVLLVHENYDVFRFGADGERIEESTDTFPYILCAVCPLKSGKPVLTFSTGENVFVNSTLKSVVTAPTLGFMYPAFNERKADIYTLGYYARDIKDNHAEFAATVFGAQTPMPAAEQKQTFGAVLSESVSDALDLDVVSTVHSGIAELIEEHKQSKERDPLTISNGTVKRILRDGGVDEEHVEAFGKKFDEDFGKGAELRPKNIVDPKKFELKTPDVSIKVSPEKKDLVETRVIDGVKFILVRADGGVELNGVNIEIK